mgnify:FL=1|jgi:hypothetical protein
MSYGFAIRASNGDLVADSSLPVGSLIKIDSLTLTLEPSSSQSGVYPSSYIYDLPGVSSTADLRDNYIVARATGGGGIGFGGTGNFVISFHSAGKIKFENNSSCTTLSGAYRQCTYLDAVTNTYEIYTIGKTV